MVDDQTDGASTPPQESAEPRWCVVGNVVAERLHGEQGVQRPGSKVFAGGTRVYYRSAYWGVGGEQVTVLGIARRPRRWITTTLRTSLIENWRPTVVHKPRVLHELADDDPMDEDDARELAGRMNRISAASNWRLVTRTVAEYQQAAVGAHAPIVRAPGGTEPDQAFILYRGVEAVAGVVYQAEPPSVRAPRTALFTWSSLWLRPAVEPAERAEWAVTLFTALTTRLPGHDLSTALAQMRTTLGLVPLTSDRGPVPYARP